MRLRSAVLVAAVLAGLAAPAVQAAGQPAPKQNGPDDAVVIAVIDSAMNPYLWDFRADLMPQAKSKDKTDDLPLTKAPHTWLPGFPKPATFASYRALPIHLSTAEDDNPSSLDAEDESLWSTVEASSAQEVAYHWIPRTKVIGALTFGTGGKIHGSTSEHGVGTTSVSTGNLYGTCPECVLVFIQYGDAASGEDAIEWAMGQPWIDAISNSYGFSAAYRDRIYSGSNTTLQQKVSERGQSVFFSAGNGQDGSFAVPNSTLLSSQEGPDWIVTVGATSPGGNDYTGSGKPVDVAGIGSSYPSGYGATTVTDDGTGFGGTSNATPTLAGIYGRVLYLTRRAMPGRSRVQDRSVIARGAIKCGAARPACELRDGVLTAAELRQRVFRSATPTGGEFTDPVLETASIPGTEDTRLATEGHGTYRARLDGDAAWLKEFDRVAGPLFGRTAEPARPADEADWFRVDSWCRQHIWGEWTGGYYRNESSTPLPADDPAWPLRTAIRQSCSALAPPPSA